MKEKFTYISIENTDFYLSKYDEDLGTKFSEARFKIFQEYDTCPLCRNKIKNCSLYLILNNFKKFPNTVCHAECVDKFKSRQEMAEALEKDYNEYLKYKHWERK